MMRLYIGKESNVIIKKIIAKTVCFRLLLLFILEIVSADNSKHTLVYLEFL